LFFCLFVCLVFVFIFRCVLSFRRFCCLTLPRTPLPGPLRTGGCATVAGWRGGASCGLCRQGRYSWLP
jgi:hypothetical protein